ncbi:unnamed protein product [Colletotrichum noveboracense]|uniref:Uncharacterized protein n=1 Tax=Colletotrichum noveboracense TaxID=2664923 RepID=A0A9W4WB78_9PEZI|nr:unnamed protein product [Colletotrichum noveboracense]
MTPQRCIELAGSLRYAGVFFELSRVGIICAHRGLWNTVPKRSSADMRRKCGYKHHQAARAAFQTTGFQASCPWQCTSHHLRTGGFSCRDPCTTTTTIPVGGDSVLPSTPITLPGSAAPENITPITNGGTPAGQLTTIGNTLDPAVPPQPSSFTSVFIVDGVPTTLAGATTPSTTAPSSPTTTVIPAPGDDVDVLNPSSSVGLAGSQTVPNVGSPTAGSGADIGDDGDVLDPSSSGGLAGSQTVSNVGSPTVASAPGFGENSDVLVPLPTTLGLATSRISPSMASESTGNLGVDMPITSVVTTITYTTINPANPTALMGTELCSTLYFPDCGCPTQVTPTVPMTTIEASCNRCGSKGESLVTLTVPESPYRTQQSVVEEKYRSGGNHLQPQGSKLYPEESQTQPSMVPVEVAPAPINLPDPSKPIVLPQSPIASAVSAVTASAVGSSGSDTSANQSNSSDGSESKDAHGNTVVSPANPAVSVGSVGAADIHSVAAANPAQVVSSSKPESSVAGSSDVAGAGPGVGGTSPGGSDFVPGSGASSGEEPLSPSSTESITGASVSSKPSTVVVSGSFRVQQWFDSFFFGSATLLSITFVHLLN